MVSPKERKELNVLDMLLMHFFKEGEWLKDDYIKAHHDHLRYAVPAVIAKHYVDARNNGFCSVTPLGLARLYGKSNVVRMCDLADTLLITMYDCFDEAKNGGKLGRMSLSVGDFAVRSGADPVTCQALLGYLDSGHTSLSKAEVPVHISDRVLDYLSLRYQLWQAPVDAEKLSLNPTMVHFIGCTIYQFLLDEWWSDHRVSFDTAEPDRENVLGVAKRLECMLQSSARKWQNTPEEDAVREAMLECRQTRRVLTGSEEEDLASALMSKLSAAAEILNTSLKWRRDLVAEGLPNKDLFWRPTVALFIGTILPRHSEVSAATLRKVSLETDDFERWLNWARKKNLVEIEKDLSESPAVILSLTQSGRELIRSWHYRDEKFFADHHPGPVRGDRVRGWKARWQKVKNAQLPQGGQASTRLVTRKGNAKSESFVLKILTNPDRIDRFRREVEALRSLSHRNLLQIEDHDLEPNDGNPYLVSEYCQAGSLWDFDRKQLSLEERLRLFLQVCDGVSAAHSENIVHRDIKPANIFLRDRWTPVVGDLGLCHLPEHADRPTETLEAVGPWIFMAPEFEGGRVKDPKPSSDVYSLGKLLHWLLSNKLMPREKHREREFDLTAGRTAEPVFYLINELLDKMIVEEPTQRLPNAGEVALLVEGLLARYRAFAHPIGQDIPQVCSYCVVGRYAMKVEAIRSPDGDGAPYEALQQYGLRPNEGNWRVLVCDHCGHFQVFRIDQGKRSDIWSK